MAVDADSEGVLRGYGLKHPNHSVELESDFIAVVSAAKPSGKSRVRVYVENGICRPVVIDMGAATVLPGDYQRVSAAVNDGDVKFLAETHLHETHRLTKKRRRYAAVG